EKNVLIVAAAGNDGCDCLHVPASVASVLAVGAMDVLGNPISFSNWGKAYQDQGILALGENILGATPGDGTELMSGTSSATAIVSGIVALLLSLQLQQGNKPNPHAIRHALLKSALPCPSSPNFDRQRCLSGSLNIVAAYRLIKQGETKKMFDHKLSEEMIPSPDIGHQHPQTEFVTPSGTDGDCGCKGGRQIQLVYALGELGIDFGTQACQDSFTQAIPAGRSLLDYLDEEPYAASSLIWTLNLDATPIYAILPTGAYASVTYERLRSFLGDKQIERVAIPGYLAGNVKLLSGQVVPAIIPEVRGMYSWSTSALIEQLKLVAPTGSLEEKPQQKIREYLQRIYYEFRNLGVTPQDRALNFSATNAFQITDVMSAGASAEIGLDTITVEKSPVCLPDSDCYDVTLHFFNLQDSRRAGKVYRFAVDVSDVIPVSIGAVRSWSIAS
ncbi:MAG: S8 family serine peptidase, partial [Cyanobacteria bacterium P01_G01_bin.49]